MSSAKIKKLLSNSAVYAVANLLQRGLTFILIPIYARYFTKEEFGAIDIIYQMVVTLILLSSFGLPHGLVRGLYLDGNDSVDNQKRIVGAMLTFLIPWTLLSAFLVYVFSPTLNELMMNGEGQAHWIQLSAILILCMALQQLPLQLYKTKQQALKYSLWSLLSFCLIAGCNILFIVFWNWGLEGMIWANIIGFGSTAVILLVPMIRSVELNLDFSILKPLFAFGLPMIPALLSRKMLEVSDRYIIPHYHGLAEIGNYSMGAKVANILEVVLLVPFLYAWQPFYYSQAKNPDAKKLFSKVTLYFLMLVSFIVLFVEVNKSWVLEFFGAGQYTESSPIVSILVFGVFFNGIQYCISPGIHLKKKLIQEAYVMIAAGALNIGLNFLLIPNYASVGASVATIISYFFYLIATFTLAQKFYPTSYEYGKMIYIVSLLGLSFWGMHSVDSVWLQVAIIVGFTVVGPLAVFWRDSSLRELLKRK